MRPACSGALCLAGELFRGRGRQRAQCGSLQGKEDDMGVVPVQQSATERNLHRLTLLFPFNVPGISEDAKNSQLLDFQPLTCSGFVVPNNSAVLKASHSGQVLVENLLRTGSMPKVRWPNSAKPSTG